MWRLAALLVLALIGYPLAILPSKHVALTAAAAIAVCGLGLVVRSTPVLAGGVMLALAEYALALSLSDGRPRLAGALVAGVGLALLLEIADFDRRFRPVAIGPGVLASQLRYWAGFGALGAVVTVVLLGAASAIDFAVRVPWSPLVAGVGAVAAIGAAAVALRRAGAAR